MIATDAERRWLLLDDAGTPLFPDRNSPEEWPAILPRYAELQRGEEAHADEHVAHGVPDLRLAALPALFERLLEADLPFAREELDTLRRQPFAAWCEELAAAGIPETIQHDDLHFANVYDRAGRLRVLDWGDASVAHPWFSLVVPFHFLVRYERVGPDDPWFERLRGAYLEPWGRGHERAFALSQRVGVVAHAIAWHRLWEALPPDFAEGFGVHFAKLLHHAAVGGNPLADW